MAVKIFIKRRVPKEKADSLMLLLRQLRVQTTSQYGYISGETLKRVDKPDEYLVISTWQSLEDWKIWVASVERNEIQSQIDDLLGQKTTYEIFEH